jgi:hypothetical protein
MNKALVDWVMERAEDYIEHRNQNYLDNWKKYERVWRGVWAKEDSNRMSERSKFISPALQQAVENSTSEIEEALFGQSGNLFSIDDDIADSDPKDIEVVQAYMKEVFRRNKLRKHIGDVTLLGALYGTCIGEVVVKRKTELVPVAVPLDGVDTPLVTTQEKKTVCVELAPINPQNFFIDPNATCIDDALGCGVEEFVSAHTIAGLVTDGIYMDTDVGTDAAPDKEIEKSWIDETYNEDKIRVIRWYGMVPRALLYAEKDEYASLLDESDDQTKLMVDYGDMVEALVVIGDGHYLLKAEESPYLMKDRPMVAAQYDSVPGRFWGRGICEKGWNTQAAIDAQVRSHLDSLALTTVPMMGMDATRMPRGFKFEVKPGKSILTNGNPAEILSALKFGQTDGSNIETANLFERMLLQATGTADTSLMQTPATGQELGLSLSGIIKKNKRILVNFQENFLIPFIQKAAWRFMQFDPEHFPVKDFKFVVSGTLGMLAREVEQLQFINLLKTLGTDSPLTPILLKGVVENSTLPNKQEMLEHLAQAMQPDPQQQQMQAMEIQLAAAAGQAEVQLKQAQVMKTQAEAQLTAVETQLKPREVDARVIAALSNNLNEDDEDKSFERRVKIAELALKEKEIDTGMEITKIQKQAAQANKN